MIQVEIVVSMIYFSMRIHNILFSSFIFKIICQIQICTYYEHNYQMGNEFSNEARFGDFIETVKSEDLSTFPYNCVGYFWFRYGKKFGTGTGFLIAPDLVLTAAHNIVAPNGDRYIDIKFYPGVSGELEPTDACEVADFRMPQEYKTSGEGDPEFDYALVKLNRAVQRDQYIKLGLGVQNVGEEKLGIVGYGQKSGQFKAIQTFLWKEKAIYEVRPPSLKHILSTVGGNSGSPLLVQRKGNLLAVGIHKGAPTEAPKYNEARAITAELLVNLLVWEKEMAAQIRFAVITPTAIKNEEDPKVWLEQQKLKIEVALLNYAEQSAKDRPKPEPIPAKPKQLSKEEAPKEESVSVLPPPPPPMQPKSMEIAKDWPDQAAGALESIRAAESRTVTKLTLKIKRKTEIMKTQR